MDTGKFPALQSRFIGIPPATDTALRLLMLDHLQRCKRLLQETENLLLLQKETKQ